MTPVRISLSFIAHELADGRRPPYIHLTSTKRHSSDRCERKITITNCDVTYVNPIRPCFSHTFVTTSVYKLCYMYSVPFQLQLALKNDTRFYIVNRSLIWYFTYGQENARSFINAAKTIVQTLISKFEMKVLE